MCEKIILESQQRNEYVRELDPKKLEQKHVQQMKPGKLTKTMRCRNFTQESYDRAKYVEDIYSKLLKTNMCRKWILKSYKN